MNDEQRALQLQIRIALGVADAFDAQAEIDRRVEFLAELLRATCAAIHCPLPPLLSVGTV